MCVTDEGEPSAALNLKRKMDEPIWRHHLSDGGRLQNLNPADANALLDVLNKSDIIEANEADTVVGIIALTSISIQSRVKTRSNICCETSSLEREDMLVEEKSTDVATIAVDFCN